VMIEHKLVYVMVRDNAKTDTLYLCERIIRKQPYSNWMWNVSTEVSIYVRHHGKQIAFKEARCTDANIHVNTRAN